MKMLKVGIIVGSYATGTESRGRRRVGAQPPEKPHDAEFELSTSRITNCHSSMSRCPPSCISTGKRHTKSLE